MKKNFPFLLSAFVILLAAVLFSCSHKTPEAVPTPEELVRQQLGAIYGRYHENAGGWFIRPPDECDDAEAETDCDSFDVWPESNESDYLMTVKQIDRKDIPEGNADGWQGERFYVQVTGVKGGAAQVEPGLLGYFLYEMRNGKLELVGGLPYIYDGEAGHPYANVGLVKLSDDGYWAWYVEKSTRYASPNWTVILGPQEGKVVPLLELVTSFSFLREEARDRRGDDCFPYATELEADILIDDSVKNRKLYPLKATASGRLRGKKIRTRTVILHFDEKKREYSHPKNWPLDDIKIW